MEDNLKFQWSELADILGQTGLDILAAAPVTVTEKRFAEPRVLAIMLMSRTLSNFRGVFALLENGLVNGGENLGRRGGAKAGHCVWLS
jgi:hypothetical protein